MPIPIQAPVPVYQFDSTLLAKAHAVGTHQGQNTKSVWSYLDSGIQKGLQMGMLLDSKYGKEAVAARERQAELETLQIQQAKQNLSASEFKLNQDRAAVPLNEQLNGLKIKEAELGMQKAQFELDNAQGVLDQKKNVADIQAAHAQTQLALTNIKIAADAQEAAKRGSLINKINSAKTADEFSNIYKDVTAYALFSSPDQYTVMQGIFQRSVLNNGLGSDPKLQGLLSTWNPLTLSGIDAQINSLANQAKDYESQIKDWNDSFVDTRTATAKAAADAALALDAQTAQPVQPSLQTAIAEQFGFGATARDIISGIGPNPRPTKEGQTFFKNLHTGKEFALDGADAVRVMQLLNAEAFRNKALTGLEGYRKARSHMVESGATTINPKTLQEITNPQASRPPAPAATPPAAPAAGAANPAQSPPSPVTMNGPLPAQPLNLNGPLPTSPLIQPLADGSQGKDDPEAIARNDAVIQQAATMIERVRDGIGNKAEKDALDSLKKEDPGAYNLAVDRANIASKPGSAVWQQWKKK